MMAKLVSGHHSVTFGTDCPKIQSFRDLDHLNPIVKFGNDPPSGF